MRRDAVCTWPSESVLYAYRFRLAYCELYVTLGRLFRKYDNLTTRKKAPEEMVLDDYFSSHHPVKYSEFFFEQKI